MSHFNFDLGLGSTQPKSLNDQKKNPTSSGYSSYSYSSSTTTTAATQPKPSWQSNKPSWTHQPGQTGLNGPTSMVGDISGKSWNSTVSDSSTGIGIGIVQNNPSLFGDLVTSAMGKGGNKNNSNAPLKNATSTANKSAYSMGNLAGSLPKSDNSAKSANLGGSNGGLGGYAGGYSAGSGANVGVGKSSNLGGPSMKSMNGGGIGGGIGGGMGGNRDPFGSLVDFGAKQKSGSSLNSGGKDGKVNAGNDAFGEFQNAANSSTTSAFPSAGFGANNNNDFVGASSGSNSSFDDFGFPSKAFDPQKQKQAASVQSTAADPLDMFFSPSSGGAATSSGGMGGQQSSEVDDWGLNSDFGGGDAHDAGGATTELEGLPPPPSGVTASTAKNKGMDNQKQGQYADAIKWLSWAVILLEKTGDTASTSEVLACRASCYKEAGEYKKAVADCSKVLEHDSTNVSVLVQRALLYESMEKYKLGAKDLRTVLKIDPSNRVARSTVHRLAKMAE